MYDKCFHTSFSHRISKVFKAKGINVARRTVTKYREMLNIPSSAERKRLMRLNKVINIEK